MSFQPNHNDRLPSCSQLPPKAQGKADLSAAAVHLSIGIEHIDDWLANLQTALKAV